MRKAFCSVVDNWEVSIRDNAHLVKNAPGWLTGFIVNNPVGGAVKILMFFDSLLTPPNGTAPIFEWDVTTLPGRADRVALDEGKFFPNLGITWAASSTYNTLTLTLGGAGQLCVSTQ